MSFGLVPNPVSISSTVITGGIMLSAGTTQATSGTVIFSNANGVNFGMAGQTVTASFDASAVTFSQSTAPGAISASGGVVTSGTLSFANSNGVTFGISGQTITASAAVGGGGVGLNTAQTNVTWTVNSSGISLNAGGYAGTVTAITGGSLTVNTAGVSLNLPAYITTARGSTDAIGLNTAQTNVTWTVNSSGISLNAAGYAGTATAITGGSLTVNSAGVSLNLPAYLTTARRSTDAVGLNTAQTNVTWTVNSSGISLDAGGYLTTARRSTDAIGLNTAQTNVTWTVNSSGISLNAAGYAGTNAAITGGSITVNSAGVSVNVAGGGATLSYFANMDDGLQGTTTLAASVSTLQVVPFVLPQAVSVSFLRMPVSMSHVSTTVGGTSANTTFSCNRSYTQNVAILTQGAGASSLSLQYLTSIEATWCFQTQIGNGVQGSRYTVTYNVTYPTLGSSDAAYTTSYAVSSGTYNVSSESMTLFTGLRFVDIPAAFSLSAGNYWAVFGMSTNSASNGPSIQGGSIAFSTLGVSQNAVTIGYPGAATNSSIQVQPGLGSWSTNAAVRSTSSIGLASVSAAASGPIPYFQFIRRA